ncbi:potassium-transporting ATPase subunit C [Planosporangium flavigriseum]|uniref:Potassium-transporting ATPase KdpC subunit n=1 Tax=Planosporangium flavigriseum TaxID=373681 RepID=A0A8J3LHG9_9ACTN|nr:potassium-transporting ATPase subunit C [Planosporangium flavigriseum]NJC65164.1 potassium-transporting ATPase subunit C [Planosporangium flavigriseum]GIG71782.1 potassium-transporting ATPase KdpC subunit [Planosporangium flavigriseum]
MRLPYWLSQHLAALRALLVLTVLLGIGYPLVMVAVAQLPGLKHAADGSPVVAPNGADAGSRLIGQPFADAHGQPLGQYFQSRPSAAGSGNGYDPTASGGSNLGPNSVVDPGPDKPSLLTLVCARSRSVGELEGVDGRRPYCTPEGVGAVLAVFHRNGITGPVTRAVSLNQRCPVPPFVATYQGVPVECAKAEEDYSRGIVTPVRGDAPANPAVPADAVTASASGLDPDISPAYARLQANRVAKARGTTVDTVLQLVDRHTTGRALGFLGEPAVNVLELNVDLDRKYPYRR